MQHARRIDLGVHLRSSGLVVGVEVLEQKSVVAGLDADDVVRTGLAQVVEVRRVGAECVLDDDHGQVGMLVAKAFQPAAGGIAFAIVLGVAVQIDERFEWLAALQAAEDVLEQWPQVVGIDRVEDGPHLRVAGGRCRCRRWCVSCRWDRGGARQKPRAKDP